MKIANVTLDALPHGGGKSVLSIHFDNGHNVNTEISHDVDLKGLAVLMNDFAVFVMGEHERTINVAPWPDFKGNEIREGDTIRHPSGETGAVVFLGQHDNIHDQWRVEYEDGGLSRLCLQLSGGEAVVVNEGEK